MLWKLLRGSRIEVNRAFHHFGGGFLGCVIQKLLILDNIGGNYEKYGSNTDFNYKFKLFVFISHSIGYFIRSDKRKKEI